MKKILPWLARLLVLPATFVALPARSAVPPELAAGLRTLQEQHSYSWEFINGDPGVVEQSIPTLRGSVTARQQSMSPHVLGSLASTGEILLHRDWPGGLQMDTLVTANGEIVTKTPEGWMTTREVLDALADEQIHGGPMTPRYLWLRLADRPSVRRPDQELAALLRESSEFEVSGDTFVARITFTLESTEKSGDGAPTATFTVTVHLSDGMIRTYEVKNDFSRFTARAHVQVPMTEDKLVVLTYLPVTKLDVPEEARDKLQTAP